MSWQRRPVFVTGAGGFIGSHLTERLAALGADVRALIHYNALGTAGWLDESPVRDLIRITAGDVLDRDVVRKAMEGSEVVFHLAALIAIPYSYRAPVSYVRTNIEGTVNVLQAARDLGVSRFIHTSTSEVYGTAQYVPIDERHPVQGQSPYSASKIAADKLAEAYHLSFGVPVVTVRPFNTFGPRQSARAVVPTIITQLLRGTKVSLGAVTPTRDLNYVGDTVEGFVSAAVAPGAVGGTFNIGSGREISIGDLAQLIGNLMQKPVEIETDAERVRPTGSEVERLLADSGLSASILGWRPSIGLEGGLRATIEWYEQHIERYRPGVYVV